ncbi:MAG: glycine betaine ABC transporter substrate-binding protein [Actinomycetota bacterium]|nr:glycine betaine ABC transporter substrate-binding protein [Actinomycetota bacterium]
MKAYKRLLTLLLLVAVGALAAGCGGLGAAWGGKELTLGYIGWDENVAVSSLTKVLLEEELGYKTVELQLADLGPVFRGVGEGDLDAFQDVWMPNHKDYLSEVEDDVEHLGPWFEGETAYGIAVPYYMDVRSLSELDEAGTDMIIGIEPGAAFHPQIKAKVIPGYDLDMKLVESSTPAMLSELEKAYAMREPIVFLGWSPHWMNARYDFRYLEDPRDLQGKFNDPSEISTIVNEDLPEDDPVAYEFIRSISLSKEQVNQMEADINQAGDPDKGVKAWLEDNRGVVQPWIAAAKKVQGA